MTGLVCQGQQDLGIFSVDAEHFLDAVTGEVIRTFEGTEDTSEIIIADNRLFLVIGRPEKTTQNFTSTTTYVWDRAEEARTEWAWSKEPGRIMAIDMASGETEWVRKFF